MTDEIRGVMRRDLTALGPVSIREKRVMMVFLATVLAWMSRPYIVGTFGISGISDTTISIAAVFLLWPSSQPIDPLWIQLAVLFASLPIAANVFALSQFYNVYIGRTATAIMITTICASVSVPATLFLLIKWL